MEVFLCGSGRPSRVGEALRKQSAEVLGVISLFAAIFPFLRCRSITGAPPHHSGSLLVPPEQPLKRVQWRQRGFFIPPSHHHPHPPGRGGFNKAIIGGLLLFLMCFNISSPPLLYSAGHKDASLLFISCELPVHAASSLSFNKPAI